MCQTSEQKDLCRVLYSADLLCTTCVRIAQYMMLKAGYITFYRWRVLVKAWIFEFWMQILKLHVCCCHGNAIKFWTHTWYCIAWPINNDLLAWNTRSQPQRDWSWAILTRFSLQSSHMICWGSFAASIVTFQWPKHFFTIPVLQIIVLMLLLRSLVPKHSSFWRLKSHTLDISSLHKE